MISKITHLTLLVHDQDEALSFYTEKLNFKKHTDVYFGPDRWLTICTQEQPNFELALMVAQDDEKNVVGRQSGTKPFFALETTNCYADYQLFSSRGVMFLTEPKDEVWGISALFKDLYGNILLLNQSK